MNSNFVSDYDRYRELSVRYDNAILKVMDNLLKYYSIRNSRTYPVRTVAGYKPSYDPSKLKVRKPDPEKEQEGKEAVYLTEEEDLFLERIEGLLKKLPPYRRRLVKDYCENRKVSKSQDRILHETFLEIVFMDDYILFSEEDWRELIELQTPQFGSDYLAGAKDYVLKLLEETCGIHTGNFNIEEGSKEIQETFALLSEKEQQVVSDHINRRLKGDLLYMDIDTKRILRRGCVRFAYFYPPLRNERSDLYAEIVKRPYDFSKMFMASLREQEDQERKKAEAASDEQRTSLPDEDEDASAFLNFQTVITPAF